MILGAPEVHFARTASSDTSAKRIILKADKISGERVRELNIEVRAGEVLGVTGLAGSGFEELPELLFGARPLRAGSITVATEVVRNATPSKLMARRVVLIPADRKAVGAAQQLTIVENLSLPFLNEYSNGWKIGWQKLKSQAKAICHRLNVVPPNVELTFGNLSGGNQQKALIGKWLETEPEVMLLNEPTQGVDIGARKEIFKLIRATVSNGMGVLCATSDYEQLVEMADRVIVLSNGRQTGELFGEEITKDSLAAAVYSRGAS
jgi:ribose transport system ATP-binding protein